MRLLRFRLRTQMVLVAVAGVMLGALVLLHRLASYRVQAEQHAALGATYEVRALGAGKTTPPPARRPRAGGHDLLSRLAAYHSAMRSKYERAARSPWLPVEPDPPPPE